jgi:ubiquinone/menaquinone biosynthesis C-methylase UbiE
MKPDIIGSFDEVAGRYDSSEAIFSGPIADRLVQVAGVGPGDRVLDVGCGTGSVLLRAAAAALPGGHVTGVDLSERMLDIARERARAAELANVTVVRGDAEDPPCGAGGFDKVIGSLVFFLLPHPEQAVRRWLNVLRPGGMIAFSWNVGEDAVWASAYEIADGYVPSGCPRFAQMLWHWPLTSAGELERMLAECGYADIRTVTEGLRLRYPSPASWWDSGWTHARRICWQHIPDDQLPAARADVLAALDGARDPADGSITRTVRFGWTTGIKTARV